MYVRMNLRRALSIGQCTYACDQSDDFGTCYGEIMLKTSQKIAVLLRINLVMPRNNIFIIPGGLA